MQYEHHTDILSRHEAAREFAIKSKALAELLNNRAWRFDRARER